MKTRLMDDRKQLGGWGKRQAMGKVKHGQDASKGIVSINPHRSDSQKWSIIRCSP